MKPYTQSFLGQKIVIQVPDSVEEFDKLAGEQGAALDAAIKQEVLHGYGSTWRDKYAEAIEKASGVEWPIDQAATDKAPAKKDGTKTPIHISPADYLRLVKAQTNKTEADFAEIAQQVADGLPLDLSEGTRGGGRVSKANLAAAESLLANPDRAKAAVSTLESRNPGLSIEVDATTGLPTADELARAIAVEKSRAEKELLSGLGNLG